MLFTNDLGRGIYFARLNQVSKSMNYTSSDKIRYIFIADVAYTKIYETHQYDGANLANNYDLKVESTQIALGPCTRTVSS